MNNDVGILYVSTGSVYNQECIQSARSAKKLMPSVPIALYTDIGVAPSDASLFEEVHILPTPHYSLFDKIVPLKSSPFKKTLFVDTDTLFIDSVLEIFELLDKFDLAYCHAPWRIAPGNSSHLKGVPDCFPEANTGVLAYNLCDAFATLIEEWKSIYSQHLKLALPPMHDQPAFRSAVYSSAIKAYVLPPEYNIRTPMPVFKGGGIKAKILHGRAPSVNLAALRINSCDGIAIYNFENSQRTLLNRAISKIKRYARGRFSP